MNTTFKSLIFVWLASIVMAGNPTVLEDVPSVPRISLLRLLANPTEFDRLRICTVGYLRVEKGEFDVVAGSLFVSSEDLERGVELNRAKTEFSKEWITKPERLPVTGSLVEISGTIVYEKAPSYGIHIINVDIQRVYNGNKNH